MLRVLALADDRVCVVQAGGVIRMMELRAEPLQSQLSAWQSMLGSEESSGSGDENAATESSGGDGTAAGSGVGGSGGDGKGGSGGSGSAGQGGHRSSSSAGSSGGGAGRSVGLVDVDFNRPASATDAAVQIRELRRQKLRDARGQARDSQSVLEAASSAARTAVRKSLDPTKNRMPLAEGMYARLYSAVAKEISQLRVILEGAEVSQVPNTETDFTQARQGVNLF